MGVDMVASWETMDLDGKKNPPRDQFKARAT
jgi:hypothetical protein